VPGAPSYDELVELAHREDDVLGLVLGGSRGKGALVGPTSDYDVYLVVRDPEPYRRRFPTRHGDPVEVFALSLKELREHGEIGSDSEWNRYTFAHVRPVVDKTDGELARVVEAKGRLPRADARRVAAEALDGYVNCYYRSAKNARAGLALAAKLDAAESIPYVLTSLFALHERVRPYNKYLEWELERFPLGSGGWSAERLLPRLRRIVATGDLAEQQRLFRAVEELARERGLGVVIDGWEPDVAWLRGDD
jgi:predicted nucleotidyltransferase